MTTKLNRAFREAERHELQAALAALAREFLPSPPLTSAPPGASSLLPFRSRVREKLLEIVDAPAGGELTVEQRSAAVELLSVSLSEVILGGKESDVRARLGDKGLLSPSQYRTEFTESFTQLLEPLGIRRNHVEAAVHNPDSVEHVHLRQATEMEALTISAKNFSGRPGHSTFTLLVVSTRHGDKQIVNDAFRVYHSDVHISPGSTPMDALRSFVKVYGRPFSIGTSPSQKFFLDQVFAIEGDKAVTNVDTPVEFGSEVKMTSFVRLSVLGCVEVALAYAIDISHYRTTLQKMGVRSAQV